MAAAIAVGDQVRPKLTSTVAIFGTVNPQPSRYGVAVTAAAGAISALGEDGERVPPTGTLLETSFNRVVAPSVAVRDVWLNKVVQPFSVGAPFSFEYAMKVVDVIGVDVGPTPGVPFIQHRLVCRALKGGGWYELAVSDAPGSAGDPTILTDR